MDFWTFLSKVIDSCVWPAVILFLLIKYKIKVSELINSLTKLKIGSYVDATFSRETAKVAVESKVEVPEDSIKQITPEPPSLKNLPPRLAIIESWRMVEQSLIESITVHNLMPKITMKESIALKSPNALLKIALNGGLLTPTQTEILQRLRKLRNEVVHTGGAEPTEIDAENYINTSLLFVSLLDSESLPQD